MGSDGHDFRREFIRALWRGASILCLCCLLAAMAIGLWPQAVHPPREGLPSVVLPTLQTVAVGAVVFQFVIFPLVMLRRFSLGQVTSPFAHGLATALSASACSVPFYLAGGYFADATVTDVLRTAGVVLLLWPAAWSAGWSMRIPRARTAVLILVLLAVAGLPAMHYVLGEFLPAWPAEWLLDISPVTLAWQAAASRQGLFGAYAWGVLVWLGIALAADVAKAIWKSDEVEE